jgi:opacity protein-like surface antigen
VFKNKSVLALALALFVFNSTIAFADQQTADEVDISGRWVDDRDQIDIKQKGNQVTGDIGVNGSSFNGIRDGDLLTLKIIYKVSERGDGRKSEGELKISSDGTTLTGTRSGGEFRKGSEWVLTRENP